MHRLCESLPALGLRGNGLGQSNVGTWVNIASAPTPVDIEPVDADLQAEVNALVAQAEALGIDTESIQEDGRETDGEPK